MGRGFPLPSWLRGLGEHHKLPQRGPGRGWKRVLAYFRAWKNTPDRHKSIIFDISGRPCGSDRNAWRAGLWPVGRMLDTPGLMSPLCRTTTAAHAWSQQLLSGRSIMPSVTWPVASCRKVTVCQCSSLSEFKRRLKTLLFRQTFSSTTWTVRQRLWSHLTCWRYTN